MDTNHTNGKHDVWTHRILVTGLAGCSIVNVLVIGYLAADGAEIPGALSALAFTTIGALVGMLTTIMRENLPVQSPPAPPNPPQAPSAPTLPAK